MVNIKRVRILLRVSSNQQLETDGDLSIQRQLVLDYVATHDDWILDKKEYYEGSTSGYRNAVSSRDTLQEALTDAKRHEYDILAAYKDDRIGRRMWEIGAYVMTLKSCGVDIYTVKDGCISPENDDIIGQMMLALRYGNAQKSSSDTGMRVKDNARKLVQKGKFMGGSPPYGYRLVFSGELSKHGRALHKLEIVPRRAEAVKYIYYLSLHKEFGSVKIAKLLNEDTRYKALAPNDVWKSGTVTSILTNPIYAGYAAYKRRERVNGGYHRLGSDDWIYAEEANKEIQIIDSETWNRTQEKRKCRAAKYRTCAEPESIPVITRNDGIWLLTDIIYCGICGRKMTNAGKYSYWTTKGSGEKRSSKFRIYRCQSQQSGVLHEKMPQLRTDGIDQTVLTILSSYLENLFGNEEIPLLVKQKHNLERQAKESEKKKLQNELAKLLQDIAIMQEHIPDAMTGKYSLSVDEISDALRRLKEKKEVLEKKIQDAENLLTQENAGSGSHIPDNWQQVVLGASKETQRVLVNMLVHKIEVYQEKVIILFKMHLPDIYHE